MLHFFLLFSIQIYFSFSSHIVFLFLFDWFKHQRLMLEPRLLHNIVSFVDFNLLQTKCANISDFYFLQCHKVFLSPQLNDLGRISFSSKTLHTKTLSSNKKFKGNDKYTGSWQMFFRPVSGLIINHLMLHFIPNGINVLGQLI